MALIQERWISRNYDKSRFGRKVKWIVLHTYAGGGASCFNWFNRVGGSSSAHYGIRKDGVAEQYVHTQYTAWHSSSGEVNMSSIGIEHQDDANPNDSVRTDALYETSSHVVAINCEEFGIPCKLLTKAEFKAGQSGVILHNYSANDGRTCPAGLNCQRIVDRAFQILKGTIEPPKEELYIDTEEEIMVRPNWGISYIAEAAGYSDYGQVSRWNYIANLNGFSDYTMFKLYPGKKVRVRPKKEDIKMIEDLQKQLADAQRELEAKTSTIETLIKEKESALSELKNFREENEEEFWKSKKEADDRYNALLKMKDELEEKLKLIEQSGEDMTLAEAHKILKEEHERVKDELQKAKEVSDSTGLTADKVSAIFAKIRDLANNPEKISPEHFPESGMFKWKQWGKQSKLREFLQKVLTWVVGGGLGTGLFVLVEFSSQFTNVEIPKEWTLQTLVTFIVTVGLILIKFLQNKAKKNEPLIQAIKSENPLVDVYKGTIHDVRETISLTELK